MDSIREFIGDLYSNKKERNVVWLCSIRGDFSKITYEILRELFL